MSLLQCPCHNAYTMKILFTRFVCVNMVMPFAIVFTLILLFLWLFPSSGVAAMVVDRLFQVSPVSFIALSHSYSLHVPLAHILPPCLWSPSLPFPGIAFVITLLTTLSSSILMTCPYHFSLLSVIFLDACTTFVVPRMCSFLILSFLVPPHIYLIILISFTSILDSCRLVVAQVSAPYSIAGLTTVL